MTWVRIDDAALHHEKLLAAGPDAVTLWLAGLCYANRHVTDGALQRSTLGALYPSEALPLTRAKRAAARLVELRLWDATETGWQIHNYERYQREAMSATRDRRREADKLSKRDKRDPKSATDPPHVGALSDSDTPQTFGRSESERSTVGTVSVPSRARDPVPSRPVPSRAPSERESAPSREPSADLRESAAIAWRRGYCERFERLCAVAAAPPTGADLAALIDRTVAQKSPDAYVTNALDAFFADAWCAERRFPIGHLAKHSDRYAVAKVVTSSRRREKARGEDPDKYQPLPEWTPSPLPDEVLRHRARLDNVVPIGEAARGLLASVGLKPPEGA